MANIDDKNKQNTPAGGGNISSGGASAGKAREENAPINFPGSKAEGTTGASSTGSTGQGKSTPGSSIPAQNQPASSMKDTAKGVMDEAKNTAGQVYETAAEKASSTLSEQKTHLAGGLTTVADSIRKASENLNAQGSGSGIADATARYTDTAAQKLEDVAHYFERKDPREMLRDLEGFARRNPAYFIGGAVILGMLGARFLKSSNPRQITQGNGGRRFNTTPDRPETGFEDTGRGTGLTDTGFGTGTTDQPGSSSPRGTSPNRF